MYGYKIRRGCISLLEEKNFSIFQNFQVSHHKVHRFTPASGFWVLGFAALHRAAHKEIRRKVGNTRHMDASLLHIHWILNYNI